MNIRTGIVGVFAFLAVTAALAGCGSDADSPGVAPTMGTSTSSAAADPAPDLDKDSAGLAGISFPPGAVISELGADQKHYEVTGMTFEEVKAFFEDQMTSAGYVRAQEASASRFYDKGGKRIQVTWSDQQGTIRGVVRVTRK